jgi:hypothetical protein
MTRILEHLSHEGVDPNGVEAKLKSGDGIDEMCRRLCETPTGDAAVDVNIEKTALLEADIWRTRRLQARAIRNRPPTMDLSILAICGNRTIILESLVIQKILKML